MTDRAKKISELTAKTSLANSDVFVIVDSTSNTTKKVAANTVSNYVLSTLPIILANSTSFIANSSHYVILADTGNLNNNMFIQFPTVSSNGKVYTVKNINSSYSVYIHSANSGGINNIEEVGSGYLVGNTELSFSASVTWIHYNGIYRIINKN